ncbi:DUF6415 family natural product biosynthesis protein [Streptomyces sp. NPDC051162]|uniref:DUF6415 family natural product biosynthesis protein n=1 Tax=Streptomyces sp. NPDC051162 TaxID=3154747 RepID=UPI00343EAF23
MPPFPRTSHLGGGHTRPDETVIEDVIREANAMQRLLAPPGRLTWLTACLRRFIAATADDVEAAATARPVGDPVRLEALVVVREARYRLRLGPGDGYVSAIACVRSLGRAAEALRHEQRRLRRDLVPVAGSSGPGVIVLGPSETCLTCLELVELRHQLEVQKNWCGVRDANARLARHRTAAHHPVPLAI